MRERSTKVEKEGAVDLIVHNLNLAFLHANTMALASSTSISTSIIRNSNMISVGKLLRNVNASSKY